MSVERPELLWWLLGLVLIGWAARRASRHWPWWRRQLVTGLRMLAYGLVVLAAAQWGVTRHLPSPPAVAVAVDASASMDAGELRWVGQQLQALDATLPPTLPRALLVFAGTSALAAPFAPTTSLASAWQQWQQAPDATLPRDETNIAQAILTAVELFPEGAAPRLLLLSDGNATTGETVIAARLASERGVRISPIAPDVSADPDVAVRRMLAPHTVRAGETLGVDLVLDNRLGQPTSAAVILEEGATTVTRQTVRIPAGLSRITLPYEAVRAGSHFLTARVEAEGDHTPDNNVAEAAVEVIGAPRVLYLTEMTTRVPFVAQTLRARGMQVDLMTPGTFPESLPALLAYDAVVLDEVSRHAPGAGEAKLLQEYLEQFGGGLMMIGGGGNLAEAAQTAAPIDPLLPVAYELGGPVHREVERRVSVMLLIDRSLSMEGQRLLSAKRAAVELVKHLKPQDLLGVYAFDVQVYPVLQLMPVGEAQQAIINQLVQLRAGGGTDFFPPLARAAEDLERADARVNHIILLSDGNTQYPRPELYDRLLQRMNTSHISISTIALGKQFVNTEILQRLATQTNGQFYHLTDPEQLPTLLLADTDRIMTKQPFAEGAFTLRITGDHEMLHGLSEPQLPPLRGYLVAKPKPASQVAIVTHTPEGTDDPILAYWPYGLGRSAVFTSDGEARWSSPWLRWDRYQQFWSQVVRWTMREREGGSYYVQTETDGATPVLIVEAAEADGSPGRDLSARLVTETGTHTTDIPLQRMGVGRWVGRLGDLESDRYQLTLVDTRNTQPLAATRQWIDLRGPALHAHRESAASAPDTELLRLLAEVSGGSYGGGETAWRTTQDVHEVTRSLAGWLIPLALGLFLVELSLRGDEQWP